MDYSENKKWAIISQITSIGWIIAVIATIRKKKSSLLNCYLNNGLFIFIYGIIVAEVTEYLKGKFTNAVDTSYGDPSLYFKVFILPVICEIAYVIIGLSYILLIGFGVYFAVKGEERRIPYFFRMRVFEKLNVFKNSEQESGERNTDKEFISYTRNGKTKTNEVVDDFQDFNREERKSANGDKEKSIERRRVKPVAIILSIAILVGTIGLIFIISNKNQNTYENIEEIEEEKLDVENSESFPIESDVSRIEQPYEKEIPQQTYDESISWYDFSESEGLSEFYGVWCAAAKSKEDAINIAQNMVSIGISGQVYYSASWGNLASDGWYVVSAGSYNSETEANAVLIRMKEYYPNAYVKYSGPFIGDKEEKIDTYIEGTIESNIDDKTQEQSVVEELIKLALSRELQDDDLTGYSSFELSAARNGIYAKYGYVFQSEEWNVYFAKYEWYMPDPSFSISQLPALQNKNAGIIREYEDKNFGGIYSFDN